MPSHFPFVLAYDSRLLAQQFTLVEKSALDEVDWKDLVEMKWNNTSPSIVSWVHFLAEKERKGIDIVVASHPVDPYLIDFLERKIAPNSRSPCRTS